ncbi:MAG: type II toxin-antitoxin system RelE/ParE family toxin [Promethearchaeota archaeon]|nr:MAG: type II toxin-antitoxin system RelE/ParE family toxin [Candidatus Lokiarchaeota archaeon]
MILVTFLEEAEDEMNASAQFYDHKAFGLGLDFLEEIERAIHLIAKNPELTPAIENIHKYNTRKFPFSIYYVYDTNEEKIIILTIAHQKRRPGYWKERIS